MAATTHSNGPAAAGTSTAAGEQGSAQCRNCFEPLPAPRPRFCGACGQETHVRPPTLGEFVQQFGGTYFSTEGALWRTLALLLGKPGELTRRYLAGRRRHYVLPLRLYITISLAVLLLLRLATPMSMNIDDHSVAALGDKGSFTILDLDNGSRAGIDQNGFFCEKLPQWLCAGLATRLDMDRKSFLRELRRWPERFLSAWGTAMFLLVPLFAAFTQLVHWRRRLRYTEHLVYALHVHSFWFLAIAVMLVPLPGTGWALAAMPVYGLLAARRVYGSGWWGTLLRALVVAALYGLMLGLALGVVALWALMFG